MAGTVKSPEGQLWTAASWLFDWVVREVASELSDRELAARLQDIADNNLGWLGLAEFTDEQTKQILEVIRSSLLPAAQRGLPQEIKDRDRALEHIQTLVDLSSDLSVLDDHVGQLVTRVRRVFFEVDGGCDRSVGALEISFDDGVSIVFDVAGNGQDISIKPRSWADPFEGKMTAENIEFVRRSGKWTAFDVSVDSPYSSLIGKPLTKQTPIIIEGNGMIGVSMDIGGHTVKAEVVADDLKVDIQQ